MSPECLAPKVQFLVPEDADTDMAPIHCEMDRRTMALTAGFAETRNAKMRDLRAPTEKQAIRFPLGVNEFIYNTRALTGPCLARSLVSPMGDFTGQLQAAKIRATREAGLQPPSSPETEALSAAAIRLDRPDPAAASPLPGPNGLPEQLVSLVHWDSPVAGLAPTLQRAFAPGIAASAPLPMPEPLAEGAQGNSVAGPQAGHPLAREIEDSFWRGPLWCYLGLLAGLQAAPLRRVPSPHLFSAIAVMPASRATYPLRIDLAGGQVTGITRRTPTDHLLAPGGALTQTSAGLSRGPRTLAPAIIALPDPFGPVTVREAQDA
ncbi:MAG: [NiFe]-hydrogenase assembly chaperone HybE [Tabrizicola sp.]|jgi:hypothetical protein|nr:[NiFe]-hydrogenase assembly chaperone HybE [Tabrizicola sp.]